MEDEESWLYGDSSQAGEQSKSGGDEGDEHQQREV